MNSSFAVVFAEDLRIGREADLGAVRARTLPPFFRSSACRVRSRLLELPVAEARDFELRGERVHRLRADAVQADGELEDVVVVLAAGVDLAHALDDLAERNAAAVVAHRRRLRIARDLDPSCPRP